MLDTLPVLKHREAFVKALKNYQPSIRARRIMASTPFVVLSGIAGGGRNTVIRRLVEKGGYQFVVSDTTRPPKMRDGRMEQNGVEYYFRSEEEMLQEIKQGDFVEAELIHNQQVSGTSIRGVERVIAAGNIPIQDCEYGGANTIHAIKPDAIIIGLLPPSFDEWIRRFKNREAITEQEFTNRLITAKNVLENILSKPYFKIVINDDIDRCVSHIEAIVESKTSPPLLESRGKAIAQAILSEVNTRLQ